MLEAVAGQTFPATASGLAGKVGSLTVEVYDLLGASVIAPETAPVTEPRPGSYLANLNLPNPGSFVVRWVWPSVGGAQAVTYVEPVRVSPDTQAVSEGTVTPSVADVAHFVRARTRDSNGLEVGTFTDLTRPTATEVQYFIESARAEVEAHYPNLSLLNPDDYPLVKRIIALRAAQEIEISYDPDRSGGGASAALNSLHGQAMGTLSDRLAARGQGVRHKNGSLQVFPWTRQLTYPLGPILDPGIIDILYPY